jgi:hypothetical protein
MTTALTRRRLLAAALAAGAAGPLAGAGLASAGLALDGPMQCHRSPPTSTGHS